MIMDNKELFIKSDIKFYTDLKKNLEVEKTSKYIIEYERALTLLNTMIEERFIEYIVLTRGTWLDRLKLKYSPKWLKIEQRVRNNKFLGIRFKGIFYEYDK